jgi:hypothetical protein
MVAKADMPDDLNDPKSMLDATTDAAFCATSLAEYVPVDPSVRPMRPE